MDSSADKQEDDSHGFPLDMPGNSLLTQRGELYSVRSAFSLRKSIQI